MVIGRARNVIGSVPAARRSGANRSATAGWTVGLPWTRSSVRVQGDRPDGRHSDGWSQPDRGRRPDVPDRAL